MVFYFRCCCHGVRVGPLKLDTDPALIRCAVSGEEASIPLRVLTGLEGVSADDAMISNFDVAHRKRILQSLWNEMPADFPFTLEIGA